MARILLLEPDRILGKTYVAALEHAGHSVVWQRSAAAAIQALDEQPADAVVVELQVPRHNGLEFLYELRSYSDWQNIPVVVHSHVGVEKLQHAITYSELNISEYLYKPKTTLSQLMNAVNSVAVA